MQTMKSAAYDLFGQAEEPWVAYKPIIRSIREEPNSCVWDIPYTIPQLGYLTHNHFRYYGKFPSVVAGQILDDFPPSSSKDYVLDNFCGSGTTLVEAKLRGIPSFGLDVSWLSVLASNVKVHSVDFDEVKRIAEIVIDAGNCPSNVQLDADKYRDKWWSEEISETLFKMQNAFLSQGKSKERDFCLTAYLGIVRRTSYAYDGEVRPHINKDKMPREPVSAFKKKIADMIERHREFMEISCKSCSSNCILADNKKIEKNKLPEGNCYLVISHPPYLNSFDYSPVYSQEYFWSKPFRPKNDDKERRLAELKAWPAKDRLIEDYYAGLARCYKEVFDILEPGGKLAIVIGDCTIQRELEPVLEKCVSLVENIGFHMSKINYRTTHYGLGKYAYSHRADYHGDAEKRDAVVYFKKLD